MREFKSPHIMDIITIGQIVMIVKATRHIIEIITYIYVILVSHI